ncbi:MAG: putative hydrolase or acyltransferase of alpha/beta superfamily [Actinomycetia bacterium]|nr:putative hydrolase or acyltransferase of alpha/beta superfamily [Actinomycetes bacterium]
MRIPSSDGVELAVHDLGGDGPPLLLAHATGFLAAVYRPLAERWAGHFHTWALDFRAHGDSTRPVSGDLGWEGMADDVLATVDALELDRPFAFGHSMGGAALVLAEERRPGTFRALDLYEPVLVPAGTFPSTGDGDNPMSAAARRRRPSFASRDAAYENYAAKPPLDVLTPAALRAYVDEGFADQPDGTVALKCRPDDEAETFAGGGVHGGWSRLGELHLPVTIVQGGVLDPGPGWMAPAQVEAIAGGRLVVAEGLGHFGPVQDPDLVARLAIESLLGG